MPGKNEISDLHYNEAASLMDSEIIIKNHKILDSAVENIEDSVLICENPEIELNKMRSQVFYLIPEFLENLPNYEKINEIVNIDPKTKEKIQLKGEIEKYKKDYESLCSQINKFVDTTSESLKKLYKPSNEMKEEINIILKHFEETIKNLCVPLISEQKGLYTINEIKLNDEQKDELNEDKLTIKLKVDQFKKESETLNQKYNKMFKEMNKAVEIICNNIKEIPSLITEFQDKIEEGMSQFEEYLEILTDESKVIKFKKYLIQIQNSLLLIKKKKIEIIKDINDKINTLEDQYKNRRESFLSLKKKINEIIENLKKQSKTIKEDIINIRNKYNQKKIELPDISISAIIIDRVLKTMDESVKIIKEEKLDIKKGVEEIHFSFEKETSLDLLFLMDITGSIELYLNQIKIKLLDIIENIKNKIGEQVDINLAFIGYKDIVEIYAKDYIDEDFTSDPKKIINKINEIKIGGGDDTAEDIAFAFELALKKKWNSNARYAILIADAPCHGKKYHEENLIDYYPNEIPNRRNIEELIEELIETKAVSLFCIKLNDTTDIMFNIFKKIYENKKNNKNKCEFFITKLSTPEDLAKFVVNSASKVYNNQRLNIIQ